MNQEITATALSAGEFLDASSLQDSTPVERFFPKKGARSWIPPSERTPPIVQFVLHGVRWCKSRCVAGKKEGAPLRLVGQLALGAKRHLALVEVGGAQFLVGGGAEHVTVIVPVAAATEAHAGPFRKQGNGPNVDGASKEPLP